MIEFYINFKQPNISLKNVRNVVLLTLFSIPGDLLNNLSIYSKISSNGRLGHVSKSADVDGDVEWSIPNFFSLPQKNGESYWSPNFSLGGQEWFMRIFPNGGWSGNENSEHIDLIVVRNFSGRPSMQNISLSLKTVTGEKDNEHFAKLFQGWTERGFGHIFLQFISRSELTTRQSELMPHGALTVVCTMSQAAPARNTSKSCT